MTNNLTRRTAILSFGAGFTFPLHSIAQTADIWSAAQTYEAMELDQIRLIDVRSRQEWADTGVALGAWLISMHEPRFPERLFMAKDTADPRKIALICATGGRTGRLIRALRKAQYDGFIDVSEGMLGSKNGPGWIASRLPVVDMETALLAQPESLA